MSKYTNPSEAMDALLEVFMGFLLIIVIIGIAVWILTKIWLWVLGGALVIGSIWLLVRWLRWRKSGW